MTSATFIFFLSELKMKLQLLCVAALLALVSALPESISPTPPMGWNSWNQFLCNVNEQLIMDTADAFVAHGLRDLGYKYINIDDCWSSHERDSQGRLQADPVRFPHGIKYVADYIHSKGLKLGIYSDLGELTCGKFPGSYQHYEIDAQTFADWGIDYLKLDFCNLRDDQSAHPDVYYQQMGEALAATKRDIVYSICNWGRKQPWHWASNFAHLWRTTIDICPYWPWIAKTIDAQNELAAFARPGRYNDPDMLEVGVTDHIANFQWLPETSLTDTEAKTHFSFWAMLAAPLILGLDARKLDAMPVIKDIISNKELIAINQDPLVIQAKRVKVDKTSAVCFFDCKHTEIWTRPLSEGRIAVLVWNRASDLHEQNPLFKAESIRVSWEDLGLVGGTGMQVRDAWLQKDMGLSTQDVTVTVDPHGCAVFVLTPAQQYL